MLSLWISQHHREIIAHEEGQVIILCQLRLFMKSSLRKEINISFADLEFAKTIMGQVVASGNRCGVPIVIV